MESNGVTDVLNSTLLTTQPSGTVLASAPYSTTPIWSTGIGCTAETYSLSVFPGAQLTSGDVAISCPVCELRRHTP